MERSSDIVIRLDVARRPDERVAAASTARLRPLVVPYTNPELTRASLSAASSLVRFGEEILLIGVHTVPFPLPLGLPNVDRGHLIRKLAEAARECPVRVRTELLYARDPADALRRSLKAQALVLVATRLRWWRTAEERLARRLARAGYEVAILQVKDV